MHHGYADAVDDALFAIIGRDLLLIAEAGAIDPVDRNLVRRDEVANDGIGHCLR